jgi:uncharacterized membrane protein YdjX (TVP38/TMEM64 family)
MAADHSLQQQRTIEAEQNCAIASGSRMSPRRFAPLIALALISVLLLAMGAHRHLSFETLARHYEVLRGFIAGHFATAVIAYVALYTALVALSVPAGVFLTMVGGILFGTLIGGAAAVLAATLGAICIFLVARSALGEHLLRRAGARAQKLAGNFRTDAFSYMLFLRLTPIFPFWLVNLVPALCGVRLLPFAAATALGIIPLTFAYAFVGNGVASVIAAQEAARAACAAAGDSDCTLALRLDAVVTPQLIAALATLAVLALVPVVLKRWRARTPSSAG